MLDVGCGSGGDLRRTDEEFAHLHLSLHGMDLLPDSIERARPALPNATLQVGSAESLAFHDGCSDVVIASTVFSSILDDDLAGAVANEMLRVVADDGVLFCYDLHYPNLFNQHTRVIGRRELRRLFARTIMRLVTVTLLPPLARRLGKLSSVGYRPLHALPLFRSYYLAEVRRGTDCNKESTRPPLKTLPDPEPANIGQEQT